MEITWYGHSCFRIVERRYASIVTDPFDHEVIGYAPLKLNADVVTISHEAPGHSHLAAVRKVRHVLNGPGEYEIGGVFITAIQTRQKKNPEKRNTLYVFDFEKITVAHLGDLNQLPTQQQIESIGSVNVLLVPVGGGSGLNASRAAEVISMIEPDIVVPMHYATPDCRVELAPLQRFVKEMGLNQLETRPVLKVSASDFKSEGETRVIALDYVKG